MDNTTYCDPLQKIILETIAKKRGFRIDESLLENERVSMVTVEDIEKALESEPTNVDLLFARGSAYFNGDFQEAINSYSLGLLQEPFSTKLRYMRGRKYVSLDKWPEAAADFLMCIRINPEDYEPFENLGVSWFYLPQHYLGLVYFYMGDLEKAVQYFRQAMDLYIKNKIDFIPVEVDWIWMAYMKLGKKDEAHEILKYTDENTPIIECDITYKHRVLLYKGVYSEEKFVSLIDDNDHLHSMSAYYALANYYYFEKGDVKRAVELLDKVLAIPTQHHAFAYKFALLDRDKWAAECNK